MAHSTLPALDWSLSPERVKEEADAVISECTARLDAIAAAYTTGGADACTWATVIAPLAAMDRDLEPRTSAVTFLKDASTDKVRTVIARGLWRWRRRLCAVEHQCRSPRCPAPMRR